MSGIVGILHLDGAPIDPRLLDRLTQCLAFRGPDARETWTSGAVGFGFALLATAGATGSRLPPPGRGLAIVADGRLDGRADLIAKLDPSRERELAALADAELIVHAYRRWGRRCVDHLLGDFAFAIWDEPRRQLFCARDHLGVKPFYYVHSGELFLFSNTIDCLRGHPRVSDTLDDAAIGDFLLFDRICETSATSFADIRRLPAAHTLTVTAQGLRVERYWSVPTEGRIRYHDARDYADHFARLLSLATCDRLARGTSGLLMSGGVDSTAVATTAHRLRSSATPAMRGYTFVYDRLMKDDERHYAGLAARALGMPIEFWPVDDYALFEQSGDEACRKPEPYHWPLEAAELDLYRHIARAHRVALTGHGGDPLSYFGSLLNTPRFHTLLPGAASYLFTRRRIPAIGLRTKLRSMVRPRRAAAAYPAWLNDAFAARMGLRERFERVSVAPDLTHPTHARAHSLLSSSFWASMFEAMDPGATRIALEFRHPLFDVRLIDYVLAIPLVPWSVDKELLRSVSSGIQPDEVRLRPKSPLTGDPIAAHSGNGGAADTTRWTPGQRLSDYVDLDRVRRALGDATADRLWIDLRPVSLNLWLQHV